MGGGRPLNFVYRPPREELMKIHKMNIYAIIVKEYAIQEEQKELLCREAPQLFFMD